MEYAVDGFSRFVKAPLIAPGRALAGTYNGSPGCSSLQSGQSAPLYP